MFIQRFVTQPLGREYRALLADGAAPGGFTNLDAAVAYATSSGVKALTDTIGGDWDAWRKRWLVGIDWCRSEPLALDQLAKLRRSQVRIHDGARLIGVPGCVPRIPFHPKTYILKSATTIAVVSGSGNLSGNGLRRGHEVGSLLYVDGRAGQPEATLREGCNGVAAWYERIWTQATPLTAQVLDGYRSRFESSRTKPAPTDDDVIPPQQLDRGRGLRSADLQQLRMATNLWIEAGNLHKNRGPGQPGNQLMMSPMTRVFFGFPAEDVPRDTRIGSVSIQFDGEARVERTLRFSNNSMDVLNLPVPGEDGPDAYDQEVLLFTKSVDDQGPYIRLELGTATDRAAWRRRSERSETLFTMTSGRRWGVF